MRGMQLLRGFKLPKPIIITIVLVLSGLLCIIIYWWLLAPIISRFFVSDNCIYHGLEYYTESYYLDFEDGVVFQNMLDDLDAREQGEVIDFYHADNHVADNPIHGKMSDIYALDIVCQADRYFDIKRCQEDIIEQPKIVGDFTLFASIDTLGESNYVKGIAFCDKTFTIRYILVSDIDTLFMISDVFTSCSNLKWTAQKGDKG